MRTFLAAAAALVFSTVVANATPITFSSTLSFNALGTSKLHLTSSGLNTVLNTGDPATVISNFIVATVDTGAWTDSEALTATFLFTTPTPSGSTTDSGFVVGAQVNGSGANGSLVITWPNQPVLFNFVDGTILEVSLGGLNTSCTGNSCLSNQAYNLSGSFRVLAGPTPRDVQVPEPLTLGVFGAGLIGMGALRRRRKQTA